jgi:Tfp pilus assembly protein PilV
MMTGLFPKNTEPGFSRRTRGESAFTTIEVLVASVLLALAASSLYSGITFGIAVIQNSRERLRGSQILQEKLETIRLYTWSQVNDPSYLPRTFTAPLNPTGGVPFYHGSFTIVPAPLGTEAYKSDMLQIDLNVNWKSLGNTKSLKLQTLVSRHGIQNYSL